VYCFIKECKSEKNRNHPKNNGAKTIDADYKVLD
jgi:hypothetical protein